MEDIHERIPEEGKASEASEAGGWESVRVVAWRTIICSQTAAARRRHSRRQNRLESFACSAATASDQELSVKSDQRKAIAAPALRLIPAHVALLVEYGMSAEELVNTSYSSGVGLHIGATTHATMTDHVLHRV